MRHSSLATQKYLVRSAWEVAVSCSRNKGNRSSVKLLDIPALEVEMEVEARVFRGARGHREDLEAAKMAFLASTHYDSIDLELAL